MQNTDRQETVSFKVRTKDKAGIKKFVRKWLVNKGYKLYDKKDKVRD